MRNNVPRITVIVGEPQKRTPKKKARKKKWNPAIFRKRAGAILSQWIVPVIVLVVVVFWILWVLP